MMFVTVGITVGTPVPETAMKFIHRLGVVAVPIHEVSQVGDAILARIAETVVRCLTFRAELVHEGQDLLAS